MVHGRLLLSPRKYWYIRYKDVVLAGIVDLLCVSAVPARENVRGTHPVQAVQSRLHTSLEAGNHVP